MSTEPRTLQLPGRWWCDEQTYAQRMFVLPIDRMAFVLVDCDGPLDPTSYDYDTKVDALIPALHAARRIGMRIVYFHNAPECIRESP